MVLKEGDTHIELGKIFRHFTIDPESAETMSDKDKSNAWTPLWVVASAVFSIFGF